MKLFTENITQAMDAIKENRVRTIMSIFGIAVGIAAVIALGVVTQSGREYIYQELDSYGLNSIWIYRDWEEENPFASVRKGSGIDTDDYLAIKQSRCCPAIVRASPVVYPDDWMVNLRVGNQFKRSSVEGVDIQYLGINSDELLEGRNFRFNDIRRKKKVAIIGQETKAALFGNTQRVIGKVIRMNNHRLEVIGVLDDKKRDFLTAIGATGGYDENNRVLVPYTFYQQILGSNDIHTLRAETQNFASVDVAIEQVTQLLERRNSQKFVYKSESMKSWVETTNQVLQTITIIGVLGAALSLLVGGVGVFNIMSSSVMERTREIGIRKAIGASQKVIRHQFLLESVYISVIGGIAGVLIGVVIYFILILWTGFWLTPAWFFLVVAVLISIITGLFAGYIPARRAAKLSPVDALRYE